jgi:enoyl-CoA hydratase
MSLGRNQIIRRLGVSYQYLLYDKEDSIGIVTVNRPEVLNALNTKAFTEFYKLFQEIEDDPDIRVVILTGSGERAFIGGVDIRDMKDKNSVEIESFVATARKANDRVYTLSKPVIAAINGFALGGGFEMAMCCDLLIASENARIGQPEISLGIVPGGGAMQRFVRLVGIHKAKELIYTGDIIDARTALSMGIINKVVPLESLMPEAKALAQKLLSKGSVALAFAKKAINSGTNMSLTAGMDMDETFFARCFATEDQKEGMNAFVEKRNPVYRNR